MPELSKFSVFTHVLGTYMTSLFEKYSANSFKDLDYAMKNDPDVLYGKSLKFYSLRLFSFRLFRALVFKCLF